MILVSSLHKLADAGKAFVFSDRHAYLQAAEFFADLADLGRIDWSILQARDFKRDYDDMGKVERYQAEALVHQHMPVELFSGVVCYNDVVKSELNELFRERDVQLKIVAKSSWYF